MQKIWAVEYHLQSFITRIQRELLRESLLLYSCKNLHTVWQSAVIHSKLDQNADGWSGEEGVSMLSIDTCYIWGLNGLGKKWRWVTGVVASLCICGVEGVSKWTWIKFPKNLACLLSILSRKNFHVRDMFLALVLWVSKGKIVWWPVFKCTRGVHKISSSLSWFLYYSIIGVEKKQVHSVSLIMENAWSPLTSQVESWKL